MRTPGPSSRRWVGSSAALVALALLAGGCDSGHRVGLVDGMADTVLARPWPARVTPSGPWSASVDGTGPRMTLTTGGTIAGALGRARVSLGASSEEPTAGRSLVLPGGGQWYPQAPFRFAAGGDLPIVATASPDNDGTHSVSADGRSVTAQVLLTDVLVAAGGSATVHGDFLAADGTRVEELVLPAGTVVVVASAQQGDDDGRAVATVEATEGMAVRGSGDGEAAVAGTGRVEADGRSWDGIVVAVEGAQVDATATFDGDDWALSARVEGARQAWVDVWPVADTVLEARSYSVAPGFFDRNRLLKVEWTNVGHATSQILEAEGAGPGTGDVGFDLNKTLGHDAGIGVRRGDRVVNFRGGADIDSNLAPGERVNRELSYAAGQPATLVLRGNFPEVRIDLAVPGT